MTVSSEKKEKKEKKLEKKKRKCLYGLRWKNLCNLNSWVAFRNNFIDVAKKKNHALALLIIFGCYLSSQKLFLSITFASLQP